DDEEVLADNELSDLGETYVNEEDEIAKIFRIETNIFDFETPLCEAFNKFSYLLKIDTDLLTHDIHGFKHMKNTKMHGSMNGMKSCHGFLKKHGDLPGRMTIWYTSKIMYKGLEDGELKDKALMKKAKFEESQDPF
ncbi:hypothetical protein Tco_0475261, partial [Tanacetum coccineum]